MHFLKYKKNIISFVLILSVVVPVWFTVNPKKVEAGGGAGLATEATQLLNHAELLAILAKNVITAMAASSLQIKEWVADPVAYIAANFAIEASVNDVVNWARMGFDGNPAFITDFERFLLDVEDMTATDFGNEILGLATCDFSPDFNRKLSNAIKLNTRNNYQNKFADQIDCTDFQNTIAGGSVQLFANDFRQGGWSAWQEAFSDPTNDPYGVAAISMDENATRLGEQKNKEEQQAAWGRGFLSSTDAGGIKTPGSVIEQQVNSALSSGLRRLENADEITEIIAGLLMNVLQNSLSDVGLR